jgi:uncharacterized protein YyaL (SSP411 family)
MEKKFTNNLVTESSPYLLQHAHNPVNWYAWNQEALKKAKVENKPILISIGYSACHWCHVMEKESFENEDVAAIMNKNFINIKIDREERPDLDNIYMDAVQAITGSGGWPLNVFLTPDAKPFYGGTYFPPVKAFNRPSWTDVLNNMAQVWKEKSNEVELQADNLLDHIAKSGNFLLQHLKDSEGTVNDFKFQICETVFENIMKTADTEWGGFGKAPKFPQTFTIQYLLHYYHFSKNTTALFQALLSIDKMLNGGIYDHLEGGLSRYSTDEEWLVPHFEKMLYDNALLIEVLCDAFQITKNKKYAEAIDKTISFVLEELYHPDGGFYAALDADSDGEEGKYYVWCKAEIENVLKADADLFCKFYSVSEEGNWDEKNILRLLNSIENFALTNELDIIAFQELMNSCLQKLSKHRRKRTKPTLDDKIILGWNALMLKAIANASVVLKNMNYKEIALINLKFIIEKFTPDSNSPELKHTWKNDSAKYPAFLDDYAFLIAAEIKMYELSFDENYLFMAQSHCQFVIDNFSDEDSVFFYFTKKGEQDIIIRKKEVYDGAIPSGNSVMASNLNYLSAIFDFSEWSERSNRMLMTMVPAISKHPGSFGIWSIQFLHQLKGINEVVITGDNYREVAKELQSDFFIPNKIILGASEAVEHFPMLKGKKKGNPILIYLCKNYSCKLPCIDIEEFMQIFLANNK